MKLNMNQILDALDWSFAEENENQDARYLIGAAIVLLENKYNETIGTSDNSLCKEFGVRLFTCIDEFEDKLK